MCVVFSWPHLETCRNLVPQWGTEPRLLAVKARSPNCWTTRDFPSICFSRWFYFRLFRHLIRHWAILLKCSRTFRYMKVHSVCSSLSGVSGLYPSVSAHMVSSTLPAIVRHNPPAHKLGASSGVLSSYWACCFWWWWWYGWKEQAVALYVLSATHLICLFLLHLLSQSRLVFSPLCPRKGIFPKKEKRKGIFPAEVRGLMSTGRHTHHDKKSPKTGQETPILWPPDAKNQLLGKKPWFWERLKVGGEGDDRGWDGRMASLTWWAWVWASSRWWTGRPGVLQSMGLQRVRHDWATELNWSYRKLE